MTRWWKDLSVAKKLYAVVGIMALLIATELFTLLFAMDTLSSVRSFVGGEGFWSKAQKNAIYSLHRYISTEDPKYYDDFQRALSVSKGDRLARVELEKLQPDLNKVNEGFLQGQNHVDDIKGLSRLILRFHSNPYIARAIQIWREADSRVEILEAEGNKLHTMISAGTDSPQGIRTSMEQIDRLNNELTVLENDFSKVLGEGSRWLERVLMMLLVLAVLTVESTGLLLTFFFSRNLSRSLAELSFSAQEVGRGNFNHTVPVRSRDELGQLAEALNQMTKDIHRNVHQRNRAESASQVKTLFLANMSHEIRTPLGVILGLADILKDPALSWKDRLKYTETIEKTGKNLTRIINDILDISKVETGHIEIEKTQFSLKECLKELQAMMKVKAEQRNNVLQIIKQGELRDQILTDRTRLRQILINLINNALKFTENGAVTITYGVKGQSLYFQVADTGSGIAPESQEKIFQTYFQAENNPAGIEGTGLGLVLSKRLAQALGGDLTLQESVIGKGSVFLATIKNESVDETEKLPDSMGMTATSSAPDILNGKKVLVVEDVVDNQMLTKLYLARKGMKVQFANNGLEGVQKATEEHFDVILMDMQMPVMDGYTATRELRAQGYRKPIIALTAHAMKEDRERCLAAGCDDYLTKPLDSNVLYAAISKKLVEMEETLTT